MGRREICEALCLLDLEPGVCWAEVRQVFRREAQDYHPDKVKTLPSDIQDFATVRMQALDEAKDILRISLDS